MVHTTFITNTKLNTPIWLAFPSKRDDRVYRENLRAILNLEKRNMDDPVWFHFNYWKEESKKQINAQLVRFYKHIIQTYDIDKWEWRATLKWNFSWIRHTFSFFVVYMYISIKLIKLVFLKLHKRKISITKKYGKLLINVPFLGKKKDQKRTRNSERKNRNFL